MMITQQIKIQLNLYSHRDTDKLIIDMLGLSETSSPNKVVKDILYNLATDNSSENASSIGLDKKYNELSKSFENATTELRTTTNAYCEAQRIIYELRSEIDNLKAQLNTGAKDSNYSPKEIQLETQNEEIKNIKDTENTEHARINPKLANSIGKLQI